MPEMPRHTWLQLYKEHLTLKGGAADKQQTRKAGPLTTGGAVRYIKGEVLVEVAVHMLLHCYDAVCTTVKQQLKSDFRTIVDIIIFYSDQVDH
jgi:hypothetical protein